MEGMKEIRAIVRSECLPRLIQELRQAGVPRVYVCTVHALGAGVDPNQFKVSVDEGEAYMEKARVEFLCPSERLNRFVEVIRSCAQTGHRGDGVIIVSDVAEVISVRTGDRDRMALA